MFGCVNFRTCSYPIQSTVSLMYSTTFHDSPGLHRQADESGRYHLSQKTMTSLAIMSLHLIAAASNLRPGRGSGGPHTLENRTLRPPQVSSKMSIRTIFLSATRTTWDSCEGRGGPRDRKET